MLDVLIKLTVAVAMFAWGAMLGRRSSEEKTPERYRTLDRAWALMPPSERAALMLVLETRAECAWSASDAEPPTSTGAASSRTIRH